MKDPAGNFGASICAGIGEGGKYKFLRVHKKDGQTYALFRITGGPGLNYHDHFLSADEDGSIRIQDTYIYLAGENVSALMGRAAAMGMGISAALTTNSKDAGIQAAFTQAIRSGRPAEALGEYEKLSAPVKREKLMLLMRLDALFQLGDMSAYLKAIEEYCDLYPDDPSLDLIVLNGLVLSGKYEELRHALDRLQAQVGEDPYLDILRANSFASEGHFVRAKALAISALDREADLQDGYWVLINVALGERSFDEVTRLFTILHDKWGIYPTDLETVPRYAEYVKSDAYKVWLKSNPR